ncbi:stage II sporulation protein AA (anti-sigma F factor antagonist) [Lishizhenia tianjinensis]|uniref:Stage II sporulation protein AA (Anti-sigma F factor antagonist) n=1 Tax=Lishizhenia tianjinensis TaxID=477690 RepID=A0A1I6YFF7_9FLAO|nr:STAS domain-containing protein [Lishizhenia tianjinensis]SFT49138.1 stage II sporulation protein AA (anti-sigma F factor antagonist) [Lishizhenia tianjinensis]
MNIIHKIETASKGVLILFLQGRMLSNENFEELLGAIDKGMDEGNNNFIIDLQELTHLNSSGLNTLLKCFTKLRSAGGELVLTQVNSHIENIFEISKLKSIFNICASTREALNFLNAQEA